jgi:L-ascorbate metabolism protein UlaG (beta-lactamase superfamily)
MILLVGLLVITCVALWFYQIKSKVYYKGPISDHFDGTKFFYPNAPKRNFRDLLKWRYERQPVPWPTFRHVEQVKPTDHVDDQELLVTFVNHSTWLIQWGKVNLLTDPIWSERASPFKRLGPKRVHAPAIRLEDLPPIHVILLSHNHYDHLDIETLKKLNQAHHPLILTGLGNRSLLASAGLDRVIECDWWDKVEIQEGYSAVYTPAQHFSARHLFDRNKTLWGGFAVQRGDEMIYYAADTAYCDAFKMIKDRLGSPRLAFLPIGAYEPFWFMEPAHMSPMQAVQAHIDLGARESVAMHFGTFPLSDEGIEDPIQALRKELERLDISRDEFRVLAPGESLKVL